MARAMAMAMAGEGEGEGEGGHGTKSEIRKAVMAQRARESSHSRKHT